MDNVLTKTVPEDDLKKFEKIFNEHLHKNDITPKVQFEYAWCLVRSKYKADIQKGIVLLQELINSHEESQRDCLYYLALGNGRINEYSKALTYLRKFLSIEPGNQEVKSLQSLIRKKMNRECLITMAKAIGVVLTVGALVALGMTIASRK